MEGPSPTRKNYKEKEEKYQLGESIDCEDTVGNWLNARIIDIKDDSAYVHYDGFSVKYDEWIKLSSPRILKQWRPGRQFSVNNRIDAVDERGAWLEAFVKRVEKDKIYVHYKGYAAKFDRWIEINSNQIAIVGTQSKAKGPGNPKDSIVHSDNGPIYNNNPNRMNNHSNKMDNKVLDLENSKNNLDKNDPGSDGHHKSQFYLKIIEGDGNCLFRAFSDQIYKTEEHHKLIREYCVKYLGLERSYFKNFIIDGDKEEIFEEYLYTKSKDRVWGDDVEIQALSEIYERSVEIYVNSDKPMRTFHESFISGEKEPIRLLYRGKSHYDSLHKPLKKNSPPPIPGEIESLALESAKARRELIEKGIDITQFSDIHISAILKARSNFKSFGKDEMDLQVTLLNDENIDPEYQWAIQNSNMIEQEEYIINMLIEETKQNGKPAQDTEKDLAIDQVIRAGFPYDLALQAQAIVGNDPNNIMMFITENLLD